MLNIENIKVLNRTLLEGSDVLAVAKRLLNQYLISKTDNKIVIGRIVETEAYRAPDDKASHAYQNKRTQRTETMFANAGTAYVYLCYGIHNMLNVVTASEGIAHAVLIRAIEPIYGIETILERRAIKDILDSCNGPGKLCQALAIERAHDSMDLCSTSSMIYLGESDVLEENDIVSGPRVGVAYAEECAHWPWRFRVKNSEWTSKPASIRYNFVT